MQECRSPGHYLTTKTDKCQDNTRQMPALLILGFKGGKISLVSKIYRSEVIALSFVFVKNVWGERALGTCECSIYCMNTRHYLVDQIRWKLRTIHSYDSCIGFITEQKVQVWRQRTGKHKWRAWREPSTLYCPVCKISILFFSPLNH